MTYPQQPSGGQHPYVPTGGDFTVPPPKKVVPLIAIVAAVVVVLGLGFTGFVAPGFLVSEHSAAPAPPSTTATTTSTKPGDPDPQDFLRTLASGLDAGDTTVLMNLTCKLKRPIVSSVIEGAPAIKEASLVGTRKTTRNQVVGVISITTDSLPTYTEVTINRKDGAWCWSDARPTERTRPTSTQPSTTTQKAPTAEGKAVAPEALAAMLKFLDRVNAGDAAAAKKLLCSDAITAPQRVDELVGHQPNLMIDAGMDGISRGAESVQLYLSGTANGQRLSGYEASLWATKYNGPWCIHAFRAVII